MPALSQVVTGNCANAGKPKSDAATIAMAAACGVFNLRALAARDVMQTFDMFTPPLAAFDADTAYYFRSQPVQNEDHSASAPFDQDAIANNSYLTFEYELHRKPC
jgi:hypothetical protein